MYLSQGGPDGSRVISGNGRPDSRRPLYDPWPGKKLPWQSSNFSYFPRGDFSAGRASRATRLAISNEPSRRHCKDMRLNGNKEPRGFWTVLIIRSEIAPFQIWEVQGDKPVPSPLSNPSHACRTNDQRQCIPSCDWCRYIRFGFLARSRMRVVVAL
ncbi:hypothetical protein LY78DRAFT_656657 [Colletotrichum sublineola]|nr:hypothetical protein LY78DRAFT_656657 [Colletotrichum sublineola]